MHDREYIIFCDESDVAGKYYSNFYGGVLVGSSQYDRITKHLNEVKRRLNLFAEVKWAKVSAQYLDKYEEFVRAFFREIHAGHVRVRIMFRQNVHEPTGLSPQQIEGAYFRLYYQFIKHAFGLSYRTPTEYPVRLKLFFDEFPQTHEAVTQFKGYIYGLKDNPKIRRAGFMIAPEDIVEIKSHDHVLSQCLDIILGAMSFRLNNKHLEIPEGGKRRGKKTVAKEKLYKTILAEIRHIKPRFNIGISTGMMPEERWSSPYRHWCFVPKEVEYREEFIKPKKKNGPTKPT
jgi:hypothetical protein